MCSSRQSKAASPTWQRKQHHRSRPSRRALQQKRQLVRAHIARLPEHVGCVVGAEQIVALEHLSLGGVLHAGCVIAVCVCGWHECRGRKAPRGIRSCHQPCRSLAIWALCASDSPCRLHGTRCLALSRRHPLIGLCSCTHAVRLSVGWGDASSRPGRSWVGQCHAAAASTAQSWSNAAGSPCTALR